MLSSIMRKLLLFFALLAPALHAQSTPDWTTPLTPFRIADNLYYVGSRDLASYLITTPQGLILINSSLASSPPLIHRSIEQLGFHYRDVKVLLISHAHSDHDAGSAQILRETHAKYMVMDADVPAVETGGLKDPLYLKAEYPPAHVDRILHDNDPVSLGGITLIAHKTPGHTPGCTTYTLRTAQHGQPRDVVIVGSYTVTTHRLVGKPGRPATYPGIAQDFQHTFAVLQALPCDIFLGAHGQYFDMLAKLARAPAADPESVWVDPAGYRREVAQHEQDFLTELHRQQLGH
jgi:metallo-beta-lactamase class B